MNDAEKLAIIQRAKDILCEHFEVGTIWCRITIQSLMKLTLGTGAGGTAWLEIGTLL